MVRVILEIRQPNIFKKIKEKINEDLMGCQWDLKKTKSDLINIIFEQVISVYEPRYQFYMDIISKSTLL